MDIRLNSKFRSQVLLVWAFFKRVNDKYQNLMCFSKIPLCFIFIRANINDSDDMSCSVGSLLSALLPIFCSY